MNCQDVNSVLDAHAPEELESTQRRDIERHFASCALCCEAWAAYSELVAEPIPETPRDLHRRVATALEEQEASDAGRARRSIILGGVLFVGAGLATTLTLGLAPRDPMYPRV